MQVSIFACITNANQSGMLMHSLIHYKENGIYDCTLRIFCQQLYFSRFIFYVPANPLFPLVRKQTE